MKKFLAFSLLFIGNCNASQEVVVRTKNEHSLSWGTAFKIVCMKVFIAVGTLTAFVITARLLGIDDDGGFFPKKKSLDTPVSDKNAEQSNNQDEK